MTQTGDQWLSRFIDYLTDERGYSAHTISAYEHDLGEFRYALARDLLAASTDDVHKFVLGLLESGLSPKSARRRLSAIRSFFRFVFEEGGLPENPTRHIRSPKAFNTIIRPITREEVDQTLASIGTDRALDIRNRALVYVAYGSGVRVSELTRLKVADINFSLGVAKVRLGKGQKDRLVPLNQLEMDAIRSYLETARPRFAREPDDGLLFIGRGGRQITRQRLWQIMTGVSLAAVGRSISPHKYRHAFVTDTINGGAGYRVVQKMVGHAHVKTTLDYMHDDPERIRAEYLKSHPRGR
jgi:site-specific recombinase XerD